MIFLVFKRKSTVTELMPYVRHDFSLVTVYILVHISLKRSSNNSYYYPSIPVPALDWSLYELCCILSSQSFHRVGLNLTSLPILQESLWFCDVRVLTCSPIESGDWSGPKSHALHSKETLKGKREHEQSVPSAQERGDPVDVGSQASQKVNICHLSGIWKWGKACIKHPR